MGFSYDPSLKKAKDQVRFLLQDTTDTTAKPKQFDDGEILWAISTEANVYCAAAMCAETLATKFRGLVEKQVGDLKLKYDDGAKTWGTIAERLRLRGSHHMIPSAGGILVADRDDIWENEDLIRPSFFSELHSDVESLPPSRGANLSDEEELRF